ncbi:hypothetical protein ACWGB8_35825 [Kitasatospora sp. NPDC054939]
MGRVGSALDNAAAESFHSTIKVEYVHRHRFATRTEARLKIATRLLQHPPPAQRGRRAATRRVRTDHHQGTSRSPSGGPGRIAEDSTITGD